MQNNHRREIEHEVNKSALETYRNLPGMSLLCVILVFTFIRYYDTNGHFAVEISYCIHRSQSEQLGKLKIKLLIFQLPSLTFDVLSLKYKLSNHHPTVSIY